MAFDALRKHIANTGNNNYRLIVYPKIIHLPGRDKPHQIEFQLVAFDSGNNEGMYGELKDLQFKRAWNMAIYPSLPNSLYFYLQKLHRASY